MLARPFLRSPALLPLLSHCEVPIVSKSRRRCLSLSTRTNTFPRRFSALKTQGPFNTSLSQGTFTGQFTRWMGCWNCSAEVSEKGKGLVVCGSCGVPQKGLSGNYFSLLGMDKGTYRVDVGALSNKVKGLQRKLHPDLFAQREKEVKETSEELSSIVNKAFGTLSHPIERGRYLLRLKGVDDPEGDAEKTLTNDPQFLEKVMELNEELVELQNEDEWRDFRERNRVAFKEIQMELEKAFDNEDTKEAQILLGRLKYYDTLDGKLKELKSKLGIVE